MCDISGEGCLDEMREGRVEWTNGDGWFTWDNSPKLPTSDFLLPSSPTLLPLSLQHPPSVSTVPV